MKQLMKLKNVTGNIVKKTLIYLARSLQNLNIPNDFILLLSPARLLSPALPKIYGVCHFEDQYLDYQLYMISFLKCKVFTAADFSTASAYLAQENRPKHLYFS